jgi:DNA-binding NtrC family response regulator
VGAYDYFSKPFDVDELRVVVRRALEKRALELQVESLERELSEREPFPDIIGKSAPMQQVFDMIRRLSKGDVNVFIRGESGTGKELVARALHKHSPRQDGPFVDINCAAIPGTLLESELFGHERGAFTGAVQRKPGKLELARSGTLFLDEIGDMEYELQAKILRALQEKTFQRVGGHQDIATDFRLISASNKDIARAVEEERFRGDLYFRLNVVTIRLPPLRERLEDVPLLVQHFLKSYSRIYDKEIVGVSKEAMRLLMLYHYPGNVRELENIVQRAIVLAQTHRIQPEDLPEETLRGDPSTEARSGDPFALVPQGGRSLRDEGYGFADEDEGRKDLPEQTRKAAESVEKEMILHALEECRWRRNKTAEKLGISRRSLLRKMNKYGIS